MELSVLLSEALKKKGHAVRSAQAFEERIGLTSIILTKLDGDARGGAAISIRSVTGVPIKFLGTGQLTNEMRVLGYTFGASGNDQQMWEVVEAGFILAVVVEMLAGLGVVELTTWIVGYGDRVRVLEPASLAQAVRDQHARAAAQYRSSPGDG